MIYDYKCVFCRLETLDLEVHHKDHDSSNDDPFNLKPLCPDCHLIISKGIKINWPSLSVIQYNMLKRLQEIKRKFNI